MNSKNFNINIKSLINIIILVLTLISFIFLPWVSLGLYDWASGFWLFILWVQATIQLFRYGFDTLFSFSGLENIGIIYFLAGIYFLSLEIILVAGIKTLFSFFSGNELKFFKECKITFITTAIICILFYIIKFLVGQYVEGIVDNTLGIFAGIGNSFLDSLFEIKFGYILTVILSIVGIITSFALKSNSLSQLNFGLNSGTNGSTNNRVNTVNDINQDSCNWIFQSPKQTFEVNFFPALIGRNRQQVNFYVPQTSISKVHAEVSTDNNDLIIKDLGSTYGTYVNGTRLLANQYYRIKDGDIVRLGSEEFSVHQNTNNFYHPLMG